MKTRVYKEKTNDNGIEKVVYASNNYATYIVTSAIAKDLIFEFMERHGRYPSSSWLNGNIRFERIK